MKEKSAKNMLKPGKGAATKAQKDENKNAAPALFKVKVTDRRHNQSEKGKAPVAVQRDMLQRQPSPFEGHSPQGRRKEIEHKAEAETADHAGDR